VQTHGSQGYVKVVAYSNLPDRFNDLKVVYIETESGRQGLVIEDVRPSTQCALIKFRGIDSKEAAKPYVLKELWVPESEKIQLPEGTYFVHELIGLRVFDMEGKFLGEIEDVWSGAANDVYVVRRKDGREILIPAVSEFVKEIDLEERKMVVKLIEGMVEENAD